MQQQDKKKSNNDVYNDSEEEEEEENILDKGEKNNTNDLIAQSIFCQADSTLLQFKENQKLKKLVKICPACKTEYETTETCVYRKFYGAELIKMEKVLSEVNEGVVDDPTSLKIKVPKGCEKCNSNEAVFVLSQHNFSKYTGKLITILVCTSCKHKWIN